MEARTSSQARQLNLHRLLRKQSSFSTSSTTGRSALTLQHSHSYIGKVISLLNLAVPLLGLTAFYALPIYAIHVYELVSTSDDCRPVAKSPDCFFYEKRLSVVAYDALASIDTIGRHLQASIMGSGDRWNATAVQRVLTKDRGDINKKLREYFINFPIQMTCCAAIIMIDTARWILKGRRIDCDTPIMFSMSLLLLVVAMVRIMETNIYYQLYNMLSDTLRKANRLVMYQDVSTGGFAAGKVFCIAPTSFHFAVSTVGLFMVVLNIALNLDYMDPV